MGVFSSTPDSLNGQHIRVIWSRWSGNPAGLSGPLKGGLILEYLATRWNFTYEMVRVTENRLEPPANGRGLFSYLFDNQSDFLIHDVLLTLERNNVIDLTVPWAYDYFAFLIPVAEETANIDSVVKPFQWPIWLGLGVSIICVIAVLNLMQRLLSYLPENGENQSRPNSPSDNSPTEMTKNRVTKGETGEQYLYVFGNLLSQGGSCPSKRLPYRLVAGVWTLAAFFFVQAYTSTLFTYVVTPIHQPLINSVYDIIENKDVNVFIRGGVMDFLFSKAKNYQKDAIRGDYKKTGKCNLQIAKELFKEIVSSFALQKNSPYTKSISQGILELQQTGIIEYWDLWFRPMPPQCNGKPPIGNKTPNKNSSLSLKNLTGAFIVIGVGLGLSFLAFLGENIVAIPNRQRSRTNRNKLQQVPTNANSDVIENE
ncbi:hypothetical protein DAPPUDRAFT_241432 [Daphnia pulex]|uniref:Ionotropic glutamate receptor C-terminal domain-containing protein n=1 Tax=Daphnia pulex TaxID=6669 RepID=E9GE88_DAPPU|nr:hypothetical protein DAPPUDRAFT_241432 [Daphnia pulex]|eukprot:EFX82354.1 hypothetical protein DAPPUDRAFT_241432 [Daphnia pulex]